MGRRMARTPLTVTMQKAAVERKGRVRAQGGGGRCWADLRAAHRGKRAWEVGPGSHLRTLGFILRTMKGVKQGRGEWERGARGCRSGVLVRKIALDPCGNWPLVRLEGRPETLETLSG